MNGMNQHANGDAAYHREQNIELNLSDMNWCNNKIRAQETRIAELEDALEDAATSLETINIRSYGDDSYLNTAPMMRAFAGNRAVIARAALANKEKP